MKKIEYRITLKEEAIFTANAATTGVHECLDFIPGSALLGAVATQLYRRKNESGARETLFTIFQSGKVRFGNAYPVCNEAIDARALLPVPLSWHHEKGRSPVVNNFFQNESLKNLSLTDWDWQNDAQPKQIRQGWIDPSTGRSHQVKMRQCMKTARDPDQTTFGTAAKNQLFGYSMISAGQLFRGEIWIDDDVSGQWLDEFFEEKRTVLLGRSRSAEFSRAALEKVEPNARNSDSRATSTEIDQNQVNVYVMSDLALVDTHGTPVLVPTAKLVGLPCEVGPFISEKSYLRTRRFSAWNAYRNCRDLERQLIVKGSVLVFEKAKSEKPVRSEILAVGAGQETGLGRVWINPPFLDHPLPLFISSQPDSNAVSESASDIDFPARLHFASVARRRANNTKNQTEALALGRKWATEWSRFTDGPTPSSSQWNLIRAAANDADSVDDLRSTLKSLFEENLSRDKWQATEFGSARDITLGETVLAKLSETSDGRLQRDSMREAAIAMNRRMEAKNDNPDQLTR